MARMAEQDTYNFGSRQRCHGSDLLCESVTLPMRGHIHAMVLPAAQRHNQVSSTKGVQAWHPMKEAEARSMKSQSESQCTQYGMPAVDRCSDEEASYCGMAAGQSLAAMIARMAAPTAMLGVKLLPDAAWKGLIYLGGVDPIFDLAFGSRRASRVMLDVMG
nr:hypothetical protein CFP56_13227 [Quercus suber]